MPVILGPFSGPTPTLRELYGLPPLVETSLPRNGKISVKLSTPTASKPKRAATAKPVVRKPTQKQSDDALYDSLFGSRPKASKPTRTLTPQQRDDDTFYRLLFPGEKAGA